MCEGCYSGEQSTLFTVELLLHGEVMPYIFNCNLSVYGEMLGLNFFIIVYHNLYLTQIIFI